MHLPLDLHRCHLIYAMNSLANGVQIPGRQEYLHRARQRWEKRNMNDCRLLAGACGEMRGISIPLDLYVGERVFDVAHVFLRQFHARSADILLEAV